jgi:hypothetical protein
MEYVITEPEFFVGVRAFKDQGGLESRIELANIGSLILKTYAGSDTRWGCSVVYMYPIKAPVDHDLQLSLSIIRRQLEEVDLGAEHGLLRTRITHYLEVNDANWFRKLKRELSDYYRCL